MCAYVCVCLARVCVHIDMHVYVYIVCRAGSHLWPENTFLAAGTDGVNKIHKVSADIGFVGLQVACWLKKRPLEETRKWQKKWAKQKKESQTCRKIWSVVTILRYRNLPTLYGNIVWKHFMESATTTQPMPQNAQSKAQPKPYNKWNSFNKTPWEWKFWANKAHNLRKHPGDVLID